MAADGALRERMLSMRTAEGVPGPPLVSGRVPRIDAGELAAIFAGGFAGALARWRLEVALPAAPGHWPWGTFCANLAGSFVLGWVVTRLQERLPLSAYGRPLLGTGLCGAFTTFSTFQLELLRMIDAGRDGLALGYAAASLAGGFAAVVLGTALVRRARVVA
jgi:fluoride exporter